MPTEPGASQAAPRNDDTQQAGCGWPVELVQAYRAFLVKAPRDYGEDHAALARFGGMPLQAVIGAPENTETALSLLDRNGPAMPFASFQQKEPVS